MEYIVHLFAEFNAIIFKGNEFASEVNQKLGYHFCINTNEKNIFFIYQNKKVNGYKFLPYIINLNDIIDNKTLDMCKVKKFDDLPGHIEICLKPNYILSCDNILKNFIVNDKHKINVEVYSSFIKINSCIYENNSVLNYKSCEYRVIDDNLIIEIQCKDDKHVFIFDTSEAFVIKIDEIICDKIEINESEMKVFYLSNSVNNIATVSKYSLSSYKKQDSYKVYENEDKICEDIKFIPLCFLSSVKHKDYSCCKKYLSDDLASKMTTTHIKKYFANFSDYCFRSYGKSNYYIKLKNSNIYKKIVFTIKDKKIIDIF